MAGGAKLSLKKMSIKTNTTMTTSTSTESSSSAIEATEQNRSPSNSIKQQNTQKSIIRFSNLSASNHGVKSAIGLSWLLPTLCAMCIPMIHQIIGHRSNELWLEIKSPDFVVYAVTEILLVFLFVMLFVTLMKHLIYLAKKYEKFNVKIKKR